MLSSADDRRLLFVFMARCAGRILHGPISSMSERWLSISIAVFLALVVSTATWGVRILEVKNRDSLRIFLTGLVRLARDSVDGWSKRNEEEVSLWASYPEVRGDIEKLNRSAQASLKRKLDQELYPAVRSNGYLGYVVFNWAGKRIAGSSGFNPKNFSLLRTGPRVELPFYWNKGNAQGKRQAAMAVSSPVVDSSGIPIAVLAFLIDPAGDFSSAFRGTWSGQQIVTYAVNPQGKIISDTTLTNELVKEGLLRPGQSSILSIDVRDPGGDLSRGYRPKLPREEQPETNLAIHGLAKGTGLSLEAYRDYRGKKVLGAWEWDDTLGILIAAEIDADLAFSPFYSGRAIIFSVLGILFLGSLVTILYIWKQSRSLYQAVDTLRTTERTLENEIELRNEFISVASHELKTPLTPIQMELELIGKLAKSGTLDVFPKEKLTALNSVSMREVYRIRETVENYLDVTRISRGQINISLQDFDVLELVREVSRRFSFAWSLEEGLISVSGAGPVRVVWDPGRIEQVLSLLFSNAAKFGPGKPIEVFVTSSDSSVMLAVRDHGPGLSKEDQENLFLRFEKAGGDRSKRGLGVGLYIVKKIVEGHGGTIKMESTLGVGSTIVMELPRAVNIRDMLKKTAA